MTGLAVVLALVMDPCWAQVARPVAGSTTAPFASQALSVRETQFYNRRSGPILITSLMVVLALSVWSGTAHAQRFILDEPDEIQVQNPKSATPIRGKPQPQHDAIRNDQIPNQRAPAGPAHVWWHSNYWWGGLTIVAATLVFWRWIRAKMSARTWTQGRAKNLAESQEPKGPFDDFRRAVEREWKTEINHLREMDKAELSFEQERVRVLKEKGGNLDLDGLGLAMARLCLVQPWIGQAPEVARQLMDAAMSLSGPKPMTRSLDQLVRALWVTKGDLAQVLPSLTRDLPRPGGNRFLVNATWITRDSMRMDPKTLKAGKYVLHVCDIGGPMFSAESVDIAMFDRLRYLHTPSKEIYQAAFRLDQYWPSTMDDAPHGTTLSALLALQALKLHGLRLLDAGTGDAVLAVEAAKEGAQVTAVDTPEVAPLARLTVDRNGFTDRVHVIGCDLGTLSSEQTGSIDVLVVNVPPELMLQPQLLPRLLRQYPSVKAVVIAGSVVGDDGKMAAGEAEALGFITSMADLKPVRSFVATTQYPYHFTEHKEGLETTHCFSTIYVTEEGKTLLRAGVDHPNVPLILHEWISLLRIADHLSGRVGAHDRELFEAKWSNLRNTDLAAYLHVLLEKILDKLLGDSERAKKLRSNTLGAIVQILLPVVATSHHVGYYLGVSVRHLMEFSRRPIESLSINELITNFEYTHLRDDNATLNSYEPGTALNGYEDRIVVRYTQIASKLHQAGLSNPEILDLLIQVHHLVQQNKEEFGVLFERECTPSDIQRLLERIETLYADAHSGQTIHLRPERLIDLFPQKMHSVLDYGTGKGEFLDQVAQEPWLAPDAALVGFDPITAGKLLDEEGAPVDMRPGNQRGHMPGRPILAHIDKGDVFDLITENYMRTSEEPSYEKDIDPHLKPGGWLIVRGTIETILGRDFRAILDAFDALGYSYRVESGYTAPSDFPKSYWSARFMDPTHPDHVGPDEGYVIIAQKPLAAPTSPKPSPQSQLLQRQA